MYDMRILTDFELTPSDIRNIKNTVNKFADKELIQTPKDKIMAKHYTLKDGSHAYVFDFSGTITNAESDNIIGGLYTTIDYDFVIEMEAELADGETEEDIPEFDQNSIVVEHAKWLTEKQKEGWSYGMKFDESQKKNPYLLPYHRLSETQIKTLNESKESKGKYGIDEVEDSVKNEKLKRLEEAKKQALKEDTDFFVEYNEERNAFCITGNNSNFPYACHTDQQLVESKLKNLKSKKNKKK